MENVGWESLASETAFRGSVGIRTCVLGLLGDLSEELDKVGQVIAEELGSLEKESVDSPAAQSSGVVTLSEPSSSQVVVEPESDVTPASVD